MEPEELKWPGRFFGTAEVKQFQLSLMVMLSYSLLITVILSRADYTKACLPFITEILVQVISPSALTTSNYFSM